MQLQASHTIDRMVYFGNSVKSLKVQTYNLPSIHLRPPLRPTYKYFMKSLCREQGNIKRAIANTGRTKYEIFTFTQTLKCNIFEPFFSILEDQ